MIKHYCLSVFLKIKHFSSLTFLLSGMSILAFFSCDNAKANSNKNEDAVFTYREVYLPEGIGQNAKAYGLNSLDDDWGIWGHNIGLMVPEKHSQNIYAKVNGNVKKKQFCFSSNTLYGYIEDYISGKYDDDAGVRFSIIPNDNDIVCICEKCVAVGNTSKDASPAVTKLVRRLAERFPGHYFFTSDYKTTQKIPTDSMPPNAGVLVSAINFPLTPVSSREEEKFINRLKAWNATTPRILVWDYINNFDDYFTPFPVLGAMQRRLKDYRDNKVTAVFLNGSGSEISAMSHLRTEVLAALTVNPDIDWKELLFNKAVELYPVTGELIAHYMIEQEENVEQNGVVLPLYEGVAVASKTYLPADHFIKFHESLKALRNQTQGKEKEEVERLLNELALTRLELNRISGDLSDSEEYLNELKNLDASGYPAYNEAGWSISDYIKDYNYLLNHNKNTKGNKLQGARLLALTPMDPDYSDLSILTDGVLGIPSNYHSGNLIMSPDRFSQISVPNKGDYKKLAVWLSYNPAYRLFLPEVVTLTVDGRKIKEVNPEYPKDLSGHSKLEFDIPAGAGSIVLTFFRDPERHSMAIEEIEAF